MTQKTFVRVEASLAYMACSPHDVSPKPRFRTILDRCVCVFFLGEVALNLVVLSSLSAPPHGHSLVIYTLIDNRTQPVQLIEQVQP